jgi:type VI secretion system protein ImpC
VRHIETGSQLKIYLLDAGKAELEADLNSSQDLRDTKTWRLLGEETVGTPGADPWAVVAGNYAFGRTVSDSQTLARLAKIARAAGSPFLAEADPKSDATEPWEQLRGSAEARWIGLAMPRFLLRAPYGKNTDSIDSFDFEEMPGEPRHQDYLWGNPAFACVQMLAESFSDSGWDMRPGRHSTLDKLPLHVYETGGEKQVKPCAEVLLTDRDTEWILDQGFMPLVSIKSRDTVRLLRFQSIAKPAGALAGRWG